MCNVHPLRGRRGHLGHPSPSTDLTTTCGELFRPPADKNTRWTRSRFLTAGVLSWLQLWQVPPVRTHRLQGGREESADCSDCKSTRPLGSHRCMWPSWRAAHHWVSPSRHQARRTTPPACPHSPNPRQRHQVFFNKKDEWKKLKTYCHYYGIRQTYHLPAIRTQTQNHPPKQSKRILKSQLFFQFFNMH